MAGVQQVVRRYLQIGNQTNFLHITSRAPKVLVIDNQANDNLWRAARNIAEVHLIPSLQVTPYQLLNARHVVVSKAAIQALEEVLKK